MVRCPPPVSQCMRPLYPENGTDPVVTYTAVDPEGKSIVWSLAGADMDDFSIENGVLRFKSTPNYENEGNKNTYAVTVEASDGVEETTATVAVTVTVTNVDEAGTLTLSTLQPVDGIVVTTTLTDIDGDTSAPTWKWAKSSSKTGAYTVIEAATADMYTPKPADVNRYLRATVTYTDPEGSGKTAVATTANRVLVTRSTNTAPVFKDADGVEIDADTGIDRAVAENTPKGEAVGDPVAATDSEGDVLTYTLVVGDDASSFSIDVATDPYVRGDDATGYSDMITVTITVTNVDEDPKLTGPASVRVSEAITSPEPVASTYEPTERTYAATDDEDENDDDVDSVAVVLTLSGPDAALFGRR